MSNVLVEIPPNQTFDHTRVCLWKAEDIKEDLAESRSDPAHWFHGMRVIRNEQEWPRYGYMANKNGEPVRDPNSLSIAKAKYEESQLESKTYDEADETVGDIREDNESLKRRLAKIEQDQAASREQLKAEIRKEMEEEAKDKAAVSKKPASKTSSK